MLANKYLLGLSREQGSILYGGYIGIIFPYSLLRTDKTREPRPNGSGLGVNWFLTEAFET